MKARLFHALTFSGYVVIVYILQSYILFYVSSLWQHSLSDGFQCSSATSTGGLSGIQKCDIRTLYHLSATLNASFQPDYDFTDAKSDEFSREPSFSYVADHIRACMAGSHCEPFSRMETLLWKAIGDEVDLKECEIYRYFDVHVHFVLLLFYW